MFRFNFLPSIQSSQLHCQHTEFKESSHKTKFQNVLESCYCCTLTCWWNSHGSYIYNDQLEIDSTEVHFWDEAHKIWKLQLFSDWQVTLDIVCFSEKHCEVVLSFTPFNTLLTYSQFILRTWHGVNNVKTSIKILYKLNCFLRDTTSRLLLDFSAGMIPACLTKTLITAGFFSWRIG